MPVLQNINQLKEEKLKIDLGQDDPIARMRSNQIAHQIKDLEEKEELNQLEVLLDNLTFRLSQQIDDMLEDNSHIKSRNSYRSDLTGYREVEEVEYTEEYERTIEALDTATKMLAIVENIINR